MLRAALRGSRLGRDSLRSGYRLPADRRLVPVDQRVLRPSPQFFSYSLSKAALWDAAVAKHGVDKVTAEVGPRPQ